MLRHIIGEQTAESNIQLSFPLDRLDRRENFLSLLHYFGLLSIRDVAHGVPRLGIPNQTVKRLMYGYLRDAYDDVGVFSVDVYTFSRLMRQMAYEGAWQPVLDFLRDALAEQTGIRDYMDGEKVIHGFVAAHLSMIDQFMLHSEHELNKGYADLYLEPFVAQYSDMKYGYVLELKYLKRSETLDEALVADKVQEAVLQVRSYLADPSLRRRYPSVQHLGLAMVFHGWELVAYEAVGDAGGVTWNLFFGVPCEALFIKELTLMKLFIGSFIGLVLSIHVGAEPLLEGRVRLSSGQPADGVQVRLFDLTDLRRSVGTTTDAAGFFALSLQTFSTARSTALPTEFALGQNYPNPFNPSTIIPYQLPSADHVRLDVFNVLGQRLATLVDAERSAGAHTAQWDWDGCGGAGCGRGGVYLSAEQRRDDGESADGVGGWAGGDSGYRSGDSGAGAVEGRGCGGSGWLGLWADRFGRGVGRVCEPGFSGGG